MYLEQIIARFLETKNEWMWRLFLILVAYHGSTLYEIAEILMKISWGISLMAALRWGIAESTRLDFGQLFPLVLLVLPLLTAVEIFHGKLASRTTFMY